MVDNYTVIWYNKRVKRQQTKIKERGIQNAKTTNFKNNTLF